MKRSVLFLSVVLLWGCTTRVQYEYFEPRGMGITVSSPPEAPPNVAQRTLHGSALSVWATVAPEGKVMISVRAEVPVGQSLAFAGRSALFRTGMIEQTLPLNWTQWRFVDGRAVSEVLEFDAPLMGATFSHRPPHEGIHFLGRYECTIELPTSFSQIKDFQLVLPAPVGEKVPIQLEFRRMFADYRTGYQLQ